MGQKIERLRRREAELATGVERLRAALVDAASETPHPWRYLTVRTRSLAPGSSSIGETSPSR